MRSAWALVLAVAATLSTTASAGVATVDAYGLDGALLKHVTIEVPAAGLGAFEALVELSEEGELPMKYQRMGSPTLVPIIMSLAGHAASFPATGWYLDHTLPNGEVKSNVGVLDVTLLPGSALEWRLKKFGGGGERSAAAAKAAADKFEAERAAAEEHGDDL